MLQGQLPELFRRPDGTAECVSEEPLGASPEDGAGKLPEQGVPSATTFQRRLSSLAGWEQERVLLALVHEEIGRVLRSGAGGPLKDDRPLTDLRSELAVTAMELGARLSAATGLQLPVTLLFDHPTPEALARYLRDCLGQGGSRSHTALSIPRAVAPETDLAPLSPGQERLWLLDRLVGPSPLYNVHFSWQWTGALDRRLLKRSLERIVARHASLRTTFPEIDGHPRALTSPDATVELSHVDLRGYLPDARANAAEQFSRTHRLAPFDLARGPLVRAAAITLADDDHVLLVTQHHIHHGWLVGRNLRRGIIRSILRVPPERAPAETRSAGALLRLRSLARRAADTATVPGVARLVERAPRRPTSVGPAL